MVRIPLLRAVLTAVVMLFTPLLIAAQELPETTQQVAQLDINSADAATIAASLDGVGLVKAREIVAYREMFGSFRSVEELLEVKGIGSATVERNRNRIVIVDH